MALLTCFLSHFPRTLQGRAKAGRERLYPPVTLFWAFLFQVLTPAMPCQEVVGKIRAWVLTRRDKRSVQTAWLPGYEPPGSKFMGQQRPDFPGEIRQTIKNLNPPCRYSDHSAQTKSDFEPRFQRLWDGCVFISIVPSGLHLEIHRATCLTTSPPLR